MSDKKYFFAELILITAVFVSLVLIVLKNNIWFDESFTLNLVNQSWGEMIRLTALDVHPPLYYVVTKFFVEIFGWNNFAIYATSVLCFIALLVVSMFFWTKYFSHKTAFIVMIAMCAAPNMLRYALQLRMYSMAIFLIVLAFYLTYILCGKIIECGYHWNKYWILLAVVNVLAAYTHYFAGVAAASVSLFLFIYILTRKEKKEKGRGLLYWCIYCALMVLLYLPWIPVLLSQMSEVNKDYWITPITGETLISYLKIIFSVSDVKLTVALIVVYLIGFVLFIMQFKKNSEYSRLVSCYIIVAIWFGFGVGYSVLRTPILIDRYVMIIMPLLWLPICVAYTKVKRSFICIIPILAFVLCFAKNYGVLYAEYDVSFQNEMVPYVAEQLDEDDVFFHIYVQEMSIGKAYFPQAEHYGFTWIGNGQVFHYWEELVDCHLVEEVHEMDDVKGDIWCFNGTYLNIFEDEGWSIEEVELDSGVVYRLYR